MDNILEFELNHWLKFLDGKNIERTRRLLYNNIQLLNNYSVDGKIHGPVLAIEAKGKMDTWSDHISGDFHFSGLTPNIMEY